MGNLLFKAFSWEHIKNKKLVLYKNQKDKIYSPSEENTKTIFYKNSIIGLIDLSFFEDEKCINIDLFEVFEKRKGYGTLVINYLKDEIDKTSGIKYIMLNPHDKASYNFWLKMGFKLLSDNETMRWSKV